MSQINDLELAVRAIEEITAEMPTKALQKWRAIFTSAIIKIDAELGSTQINTCDVCGFQEYGFRTELPVAWRERGDLTICFKHEDNEIAEAIQKSLEADKPEPIDTEKSLDELLAMI